MGHRNVQGLGYDERKDVIYSSEHGPIGGDEFNLNLSPNSTKYWPDQTFNQKSISSW